MQENKTYKLQGELVELRFLARAAELGLRVSKPYGDSAPYDFLVESGGEVFKVQVKSTRFRKDTGTAYGCDFRHRAGRFYGPSEVDVLAVYVVPEDLWYIVPRSAIPGHNLTLDPRNRRNKYRRYREAWDLLIPERRRHWKRKPPGQQKP